MVGEGVNLKETEKSHVHVYTAWTLIFMYKYCTFHIHSQTASSDTVLVLFPDLQYSIVSFPGSPGT